ncbi:MAG TPA: hypothetical protein VGX00_09010, partial [Thermoplasmata archaeon]|nr:hypothetical protein [Thermoplasmata archaeon]
MMAAAPETQTEQVPKESSHKTVGIRRETDAKIKRLFGERPSYADVVDALVDNAVRNRQVENVRRRILGVTEAIESFARAVTSTERRIIRDSK